MRLNRVIARGAFILAMLAPAGAYAFEFTQIGGKDGQAAQFQDPAEKALSEPLGGLQFGVSGGKANAVDDSALPPWQFRPPPQSQNSYNTLGRSGFGSLR
ncbi:hypothetical protein DLM45_03915 [Hyphomicrobium methylovorum]|uniref:hypothetical protein n=1 Tax=Hyphomicrobium methylovorum TaxID=84 RepID=UPI0015E6A054|nr:hypothetical protein [Hyphomicrobium methylovorum]MBA2125371.1 hypothetical protein [Hyphomicrobium methylovorum]